MLNAEMIIKRIEDAGNSYFEQRCKASYMLGMAYGEIRDLTRRIKDYEAAPGLINITYCGKSLNIVGEYVPYSPESEYHPGHPEWFDVSQVWFRGDNIVDLFTDEQIEEISELCVEYVRAEAEERKVA